MFEQGTGREAVQPAVERPDNTGIPKPAVLTLEQVNPGDRAGFTEAITDGMVSRFAALSGDFNPLHTAAEFAAGTGFGKPIAHGMIAGALISRLLGMHLPGLHCLYLSQTLSFHRPVYAGTRVAVEGTVLNKIDSQRVITVDTKVTDAATGELLVSGKALVKVLE